MTDLQAPKPRPKRYPDSVEGVNEPSVFQVSVLDLTQDHSKKEKENGGPFQSKYLQE